MDAGRNIGYDDPANNPRRRAIIPVRFEKLHSPGRCSLSGVEGILLADKFLELSFTTIELVRQVETPSL